MLYKDIKPKSVIELKDLINDLKAELFLLRFQNKTGQIEAVHKIAVVRKDIAKVLTAIKEKELNINTAKTHSDAKDKKDKKEKAPKKAKLVKKEGAK